MKSIEENQKLYAQAVHAMQSGVACDQSMGSPDGSPKHLRTGVNSAMVDSCAIARLLIKKGIITEEEYYEELRIAMEEEVKRYEDKLTAKLGKKITFH